MATHCEFRSSDFNLYLKNIYTSQIFWQTSLIVISSYSMGIYRKDFELYTFMRFITDPSKLWSRCQISFQAKRNSLLFRDLNILLLIGLEMPLYIYIEIPWLRDTKDKE